MQGFEVELKIYSIETGGLGKVSIEKCEISH